MAGIVSTVATGTLDRARLLATGHLPVLDTYRALAATAVVATHVGFQSGQVAVGLFGAVLSRLDIGVALFFSLSGFLLFRSWATAAEGRGRPPRTWGYLWRRGLRILPAYWLVVAVTLATLPENAGSSVEVWLTNLTLTQVYVTDVLPQGLTQMWSLATEVAFYLLLPLVGILTGWLGRRIGSPLRAAVITATAFTVVTVGWTVWIHTRDVPFVVGYWLPNYLSWFGVGIALAACVAAVASGRAAGRAMRPLLTLADQPGVCWTVAGGLFLVAATPVAGPRGFEGSPSPGQAVTKNLLYALIIGIVLLPATLGHQHGRFHRVMAAPALRRVGDISYGIFLWHLLVLTTIWEITDRAVFTGGFWPVFIETLLATIAIATVSWVVLERPVMRLKSRVPV